MKVFEGKFGPLVIKIKGNGALFDRLCDELSPISKSSQKRNIKVDLNVIISDSYKVFSGYKPSYSSAKEHMNFNK